MVVGGGGDRGQWRGRLGELLVSRQGVKIWFRAWNSDNITAKLIIAVQILGKCFKKRGKNEKGIHPGRYIIEMYALIANATSQCIVCVTRFHTFPVPWNIIIYLSSLLPIYLPENFFEISWSVKACTSRETVPQKERVRYFVGYLFSLRISRNPADVYLQTMMGKALRLTALHNQARAHARVRLWCCVFECVSGAVERSRAHVVRMRLYTSRS